MNQAILLYGGDWEGLYINGKLVDQGHTLNCGDERAIYFYNLSQQHNFCLGDMVCEELYEDDITMTEDIGEFPKHIHEFNHKYPSEE